jgi:streptogramin lyase
MHRMLMILVGALLLVPPSAGAQDSRYYEVLKGDFPHDVSASPSGEVWYAGQGAGVSRPPRPEQRAD